MNGNTAQIRPTTTVTARRLEAAIHNGGEVTIDQALSILVTIAARMEDQVKALELAVGRLARQEKEEAT